MGCGRVAEVVEIKQKRKTGRQFLCGWMFFLLKPFLSSDSHCNLQQPNLLYAQSVSSPSSGSAETLLSEMYFFYSSFLLERHFLFLCDSGILSLIRSPTSYSLIPPFLPALFLLFRLVPTLF